MGATLTLAGESLITRRLPVQHHDGLPDLRAIIERADVAFTHLEVVCPRPPLVPRPRLQGIHAYADPMVVRELREFGFNLVSTAHHHILDYGTDGLVQTLEALDASSVVHAGAGATLSQARRPRYIDAGGVRIALIAACSAEAEGLTASDPDGIVEGRAGINPLRFNTTYELTPDDFQALVNIDERLGSAARTRMRSSLSLDLYGALQTDGAPVRRFLGATFREGRETGTHTRADVADVADLARWIGEAKRQSDLVILSLHCHEGPNGTSNSSAIAEFAVEAFHAFVDAGADICVGHGPHQLAGVEIYRGRPIFHSLGNVIFMVESVELLPTEFMVSAGLSMKATAADFHDLRDQDSEGRSRGFGADPAMWETVVAECRLDGSALSEVTLWPVLLQRDGSRWHRGVPGLAAPKVGAAILDRVQDLSSRLGTVVARGKIDNRLVGRIELR